MSGRNQSKNKDIKNKTIKYKTSILLFLCQVLLFTVLCVNFRAIAFANYHLAAFSDLIIASLQFFVIKRISSSDESIQNFIGYVSGSIVGSYIGIYISTFFI